MQSNPDRSKRIALIVGTFGILIEIVAVFLLSSKRIHPVMGTSLVITGMLLAFVPIFVLARRHKR